MIGGDAPSVYLRRLQREKGIDDARMDGFLSSHLIEPDRLRADDVYGALAKRAEALLDLIRGATGRPVAGADVSELFGAAAAVETDEMIEDAA